MENRGRICPWLIAVSPSATVGHKSNNEQSLTP
jgi:hypothetical protein